MSADLRRRLAKANDLATPELWEEVQSRVRREVVPMPVEAATPARTRQRLVAAVVTFVLFSLAGAFVWTAFRPGPRTGTGGEVQAPPGWLVQLARTTAANYQDPNPTSARWVLTDSGTAGRAVDPSVPGRANDTPWYLVVLTGQFRGVYARIPPGGEIPTGTTLAFAVDPRTHVISDLGLTSESVDVPGLIPFELTPQAPASSVTPSSAGTTSPSPVQPEGAVSARIVLPSTTVTAGSTMSGRVVVHNTTGHRLHVDGCGSPFAVALGNDKVKPKVAWLTCLQRFTIPDGWSSWPVEVSASYSMCGKGKGLVPCENGQVPALPPGGYQAVLFQSSHVVPTPPPVDVRVVP